MVKLLYNLLRLLRPRQWVKNFAVFGAIVFSGELFNIDPLTKAFLGFVVFCGLSSATYIINDIFDAKRDRLHPFKKFRPIAHGDIPVSLAIIIAFFLITASLTLALFITPAFFAAVSVYIILQFLYSKVLKTITVIDILTIAAG